MKPFISFHYHEYLKFLVFRGICFGLRKFVEIKYFDDSKTNFMKFLGESMAIFVYLFQRFILLKKNKDIKEYKLNPNYTDIFQYANIFFMIFISSLCDLIGCTNYKLNGEKKKMELKENYNLIFLCIFICLNEYIHLNVQIYNYHIIGYGLYIISLVTNLFKQIYHFFYGNILILIISIETQYIESLFYILEKKLNHHYFIKITFICAFEGFFGIIIMSVIKLLPFDKSSNLFPDVKNDNKIIIYLLYCILTCISNLCRLRVTELSRPSYNIIGKSLCSIAINIVSYKFGKYNWDISNILIIFCSLIASFIASEVISLGFFNLDQNIKTNISDRGEEEFSRIIDNDSLN